MALSVLVVALGLAGAWGARHVRTGKGSRAWCAAEQGRIRDELRALEACTRDEECAAFTACPFGCQLPVAVSQLATARALAAQWTRECGECMYKCAAPKPIRCELGRCVAR